MIKLKAGHLPLLAGWALVVGGMVVLASPTVHADGYGQGCTKGKNVTIGASPNPCRSVAGNCTGTCTWTVTWQNGKCSFPGLYCKTKTVAGKTSTPYSGLCQDTASGCPCPAPGQTGTAGRPTALPNAKDC